MLLLYLGMLATEEEKSKFEELYIKYRYLMLHVANQILKNDCESEDAVHQAFLKTIPNLEKIGEVNSPKTKAFMVIVTQNIAKSMYVKRKRTSHEDEIENIQISDNSVYENIEAQEVIKCINNLKCIYKDALILKYVYDLSSKAAAKLLDIKESAYRKRFERAKEELVILLNERTVDYEFR